MRADPKRLRALLERLEAYWREHGAPVAEMVAPGLNASEIDAVTAPLGLRLPIEARVWFQWHDGVPLPWAQPPRLNSSMWRPLTILRAVDRYHELRRFSVELYDPAVQSGPDAAWPPSWFPLAITDGNESLAVDCDVPDGHTTPIRVVRWSDVDYARPRAASLTQAVEVWLRAIDEGLYGYTPEDGWYNRWADITLEQRRAWTAAGLV